jgi:MFS family permease
VNAPAAAPSATRTPAPAAPALDAPAPERPRPPLDLVFAGLLCITVVMGIGRFAYTLVLPLMQAEAGFGPAVAGALASANFFGYFVGSLTVTLWRSDRDTRWPLALAAIASVVTTCAMGATHVVSHWMWLRFVSGVAAAWVLVIAATLVATHLRAQGKALWAGWMFGGLGTGMIGSSTLALLDPHPTSGPIWWALGVASAVAMAIALPLLPARSVVVAPAAGVRAATPLAGRNLMIAAYSLEGLGYIVNATFVVTIIRQAQGSFATAAGAWLVTGITAILSLRWWTRPASDAQQLRRITQGFWMQTVGIAAIAVLPGSVAAAYVSSALLGSTVMGVSMLIMTLAPRFDPARPQRVGGLLTIGFAAGQMVGPLLAGLLADHVGSFRPAVAASAVLIAAGALISQRIPRPT